MSEDELQKMFEKHNDEYLEFNKIENKLSKRADLHAFILLDQLVPDKIQGTNSNYHQWELKDEIWEKIKELTNEQA
jgi:hypothetical protein